MRGAHCGVPTGNFGGNGPSPRAWGSPRRGVRGAVRCRSIPTCVGLTGRPGFGDDQPPVHPHVRGAHSRTFGVAMMFAGPSPRAWGSRVHPGRQTLQDRSIPTCVGLTTSSHPSPGVSPVHPHVRGAHGTPACPTSSRAGPSPRAWGSRPDGVWWGGPGRSIPTCVGLTQTAIPRRHVRPVHPHVRGAHGPPCPRPLPGNGPSPRAWGSPGQSGALAQAPRSIPTCVGLTPRREWSLPRPTVHPHVRGAHIWAGLLARGDTGPSPRAWGSRMVCTGCGATWRSIPTCVGLTVTLT